MMEPIVGIDLGTSTTCLAVVKDGAPMVVPDNRGNRVTPSYIHVMDDGRILVGPQAKAEVISDPYSTIWATKRLIGRRYDDPHVQEAKKHFGYDIIPAPNGGVRVKGRDKEFSPSEIGAIILKYMTRIGKKAIGLDVKKAVITVPAYFTDPQRKATKAAGAMIGLEIVRLVNEPTAAALAYGYDLDEEQKIAVFDLGGGTFDLSLLNIGQGVFEVIASDGDSYLGGEDFDNVLVDFIVDDFKKKHGIDIYNDKMAHQRVKDAAERSKIALSSRPEVEINLPGICPDLNRWAGVEVTITREQYEDMVGKLADRTVKIFRELLDDQNIEVGELDNVIMVGGMTRMPLIQLKVTEFLGRAPDNSMNPDEAVAVGAAIHAASLSGEKLIRKKKPKAAAAADLTMPGVPLAAAADLTMPGAPPAPDPGVTMPGSPPVPDPGMTRPGTPPTFIPTPPSAEHADLLPAEREAAPVARFSEAADSDEPIALGGDDDGLEAQPGEEEREEVPSVEVSAPARPLSPDEDGELPVDRDHRDDFDLPVPRKRVEEPGAEWEAEGAETEGPAVLDEPAAMDEPTGAPAPQRSSLHAGIDDFFQPPAHEPEEEFEARTEDAEETLPVDPDRLEAASGEAGPPVEYGEEAAPAPDTLEPPQESEDVEAPIEMGGAEETQADSETSPEMETAGEASAPLESKPAGEVEAAPAPSQLYKDYEYEDQEEPGAEMMDRELPISDDEILDAEPGGEDSDSDAPGADLPVAAGPIVREEAEAEVMPPPADAAEDAVPSPEMVEAPVLLDILSHTVGIAHLGGHFVPIIRKNSKLPARASQVFTTCVDNQKRIRITVLQGESAKVRDNTPLGEFLLEGIEMNKRGLPEINVTFDIDPSGIFTVSARDQRSGAEREIRLESWSGGRVPRPEEEAVPAS